MKMKVHRRKEVGQSSDFSGGEGTVGGAWLKDFRPSKKKKKKVGWASASASFISNLDPIH